MKHFLILLFLLLITPAKNANCDYSNSNYTFYTKVGSGLSVSELANVYAPYPPWNSAIQGYNAKLGHCPIVSFSLGCEFLQTLDLEVNIANRSVFKYRKFQTPTTGGDSYTRLCEPNLKSA